MPEPMTTDFMHAAVPNQIECLGTKSAVEISRGLRAAKISHPIGAIDLHIS